MPSPSEREAHLLADIVERGESALDYVGSRSAEELTNDRMRFDATLKALQDVTEAAIQIEGRKGSGRFAALLPAHDLTVLRRIGNRARHDYGAVRPGDVIADVTTRLPELIDDAREVLNAHRRLHGIDPDRLQD